MEGSMIVKIPCMCSGKIVLFLHSSFLIPHWSGIGIEWKSQPWLMREGRRLREESILKRNRKSYECHVAFMKREIYQGEIHRREGPTNRKCAMAEHTICINHERPLMSELCEGFMDHGAQTSNSRKRREEQSMPRESGSRCRSRNNYCSV
jgi:hypothetical protein